MIECFDPEVRDFLPDLVHGRLGELDTATMLAHVDACESCAAELALLREIRASAPIAPSIDVAQIVSALPAPRVAPSPVEKPAARPSRFASLRIAAFAVVLVGASLVANQLRAPVARPPAAAVARVAPEGASLSLVAGVQDLTDAQIETLLSELNNLETLPSMEPEQAVIPIDVSGE